MIVVCVEFTIKSFFDLLYQEVTVEILNPNFGDAKSCCSHYETIKSVSKHAFCPICKNTIIVPPEKINKIYYVATDYHKNHFMENQFPLEGESKMTLIKQVLIKMYNKGNPCVYLSSPKKTNSQKYKLVASSKEDSQNDNIIYFSGNFYRCNSCYPTFESWVSNLAEVDLDMHFYIKCCSLPKLDVDNLNNHIENVKFFYEINMPNIKYKEFHNFYHRRCSSSSF